MYKKVYRWKELLEGGLLVEPEEEGPYYDLKSVNDDAPFSSEEVAVNRLNAFCRRNEYAAPSSVVLVAMYERDYEDGM